MGDGTSDEIDLTILTALLQGKKGVILYYLPGKYGVNRSSRIESRSLPISVSPTPPGCVSLKGNYSGTSLVRGSTFAGSELRGSKKYSKIRNIKKYKIKI